MDVSIRRFHAYLKTGRKLVALLPCPQRYFFNECGGAFCSDLFQRFAGDADCRIPVFRAHIILNLLLLRARRLRFKLAVK